MNLAMKCLKVALLVVAIAGTCTLWILISRPVTTRVAFLEQKEDLYSKPVDAMLPSSELRINLARGENEADKNLSSPDMGRIKTFVFFIGSGKSGHSIVGSLMDTHPHVVISHEYHVFRNWLQFYNANNGNWTQTLLCSIYHKSALDARNIRNSSSKGYTLKVENLWQGKFEQYIEVIGDKSGGSTTTEYIKNKMLFQKRFNLLKQDLSMPVRVIHVVRNPFDHIATRALYDSLSDVAEMPGLKNKLKPMKGKPLFKFINDPIIRKEALGMRAHYKAALEITELVGREDVLEVHISDLINKPKLGLSQIFKFVGINVSQDFLEVCASKLFKSPSRTRELVVWPAGVKEMVEGLLMECGFLARYSFASD